MHHIQKFFHCFLANLDLKLHTDRITEQRLAVSNLELMHDQVKCEANTHLYQVWLFQFCEKLSLLFDCQLCCKSIFPAFQIYQLQENEIANQHHQLIPGLPLFLIDITINVDWKYSSVESKEDLKLAVNLAPLRHQKLFFK